ncbi:MAG: type II secretion system protein GspE [Deltaproteobacteria bacterium RBG_13_65_10]|nr:MAG: type II secretion system protein GspE [Deltaproteobacteria bacterium RBG_13_65_10]
MVSKKLPLGQILIEQAGLTEAQIQEGLRVQREKGGRLGEILVGLKIITEEILLQAVAFKMELAYVPAIRSEDVDLDLVARVPINFAKQYTLLPLRMHDGMAVVATADPLDFYALDDVRMLLGTDVEPVVAHTKAILGAINLVYQRDSNAAEEMISDLSEENLDLLAAEMEEPQDLLDAAEEAPIIRLINSLLYQAVKDRASDVHIEPFEKDLVVRYRIDGILYEILRPPKRLQSSIASRVKIMSGLNIAEKRLPQDGRIRIKIAGRDIDIRLSVIPTSFGERIVMRLLDRSNVMLDLSDIGLMPDQLEITYKLIQRSHGIILVTGPTGSGKTTTLYAALQKINTSDKNIITVEDPVEYQIQGIGQIQVNPKINLTFASALRSILRQDPDVILVGETRDLETAEIAIQASLTGHLVFSTLHTNDASGAVTRLIDMGIEPFLVSSAVMAIYAQRLVRRVCRECAQAARPTEEALQQLGVDRARAKESAIPYAKGCEKCMGTGYLGRTAIYELMLVDDTIRALILKNADSSTIKRAALTNGMMTLRMDGARRVLAGITTIEEVLRVTEEDQINL